MGKFIGFILIVIVWFIMSVAGLYYLWNWLTPEIFNGPQITFLQAIGLICMIRFLIGFNISFKQK